MGAARGKGEVQQRILRYLSDGKPKTCREIGKALGITPARIASKMQYLWLWGWNPKNSLVAPVDPDERPRRFKITKVGRTYLDD